MLRPRAGPEEDAAAADAALVPFWEEDAAAAAVLRVERRGCWAGALRLAGSTMVEGRRHVLCSKIAKMD